MHKYKHIFNKLYFSSIHARIILAGVTGITISINAQAQDTLNNNRAINNMMLSNDEPKSAIDSSTNIKKDKASLEAAWGIKISNDAFPDVIKNSSEDSAYLDIKNKKFYLHGKAVTEFQDLKLNSAHIVLDQNIKEVFAYPDLDTAGKIISLQEFQQGQEKFYYDSLRYNFDSKNALVRNARMQYGEGFIKSQKIKRHNDGSLDGFGNIYTTCNLEDHPHFALRTNKIRVIPGRIVVSGPANLEIQEIPTPLVLPFGMFPQMQKGQSSGIIIPSYTMEQNRGLGLQRGGYYFAINDYLGLTTQMDIFSGGSWGLYSTVDYAKRYKYSGKLMINYSKTVWGESYEYNSRDQKDFKVRWSHSMDPKARPGTNFSASVDVGTSSYNQINNINPNVRLNNQYVSSISYSKSWVGKPYTFNASLRHSQNTQTGQVSITAPELTFNLGQLTPFARKEMIGVPKWYEKMTASYSVRAVNRFDFIDTTLNIKKLSLRDFDYGLVHNANIQANYNVLRYFTLSIQIPYNEYWNTKQRIITGQSNIDRDTTYNYGFFATREFSASTNLSTRIYGVKQFKKGSIQGIRHVIMPSIGVRYSPSFAMDPFNYMYQDYDQYGNVTYYSPYTGSPIGGPSTWQETGAITYNINNTLQMKRRMRDSTATTGANSEKAIINLIDGLGITGSYNLIADSFKLSDFSINFRTNLFNKVNISANSILTPYYYDGGKRTKEYIWNETGKIAQMNSANIALSMSFRGQDNKRGTPEDTTDLGDKGLNEDYRNMMNRDGISNYYDFTIPWDFTTSMGVRFNRRRSNTAPDSMVITPNFTFSGNVNLTERWKLSVSTGVDFNDMKNIRLGYTVIDIVRDLHCWQMSLNLIPFGNYRSFYFTLNVKSSMLQDLKLTRRRSFQDNY